MNEESITATIRSKFDLGYIVELENGVTAQLRALEQKDRELKLHVAGLEETIYGDKISVYVIHQDEGACTVSQFSPNERIQRQEAEEKRKQAADQCAIGDELNMKVTLDNEWGYLCDQDDGFLVGAIKKPTKDLNIGDMVTVVVVGKTSCGEPILELVSKGVNA